jgi:5-methylcytosine-specific restriction protein B
MPFPARRELEVSLLHLLDRLGGEAEPKALYDPLAQMFPQLTAEDLADVRGADQRNRWINDVQWVRQRLVDRGELDGSVRGIWRLTAAGRSRLRGDDSSPDLLRRGEAPTPDLHPLLLEELSSTHADLLAGGELPSRSSLDLYYGTFRQRFGPEVLRAHDGEALLSLMHETSPDGMVYWLEFKDDAEFPAVFGSIAGGSALKYGLYRRKETGAWMTGPPLAQRELPLDAAIAMARRHRDQLLAAVDALSHLEAGADDAAYKALQATLATVAPDVQDSSWGHKYLSLLFPEQLDDFHALDYQRFHLTKLLQPTSGDGRYANAGRFVALSEAFGWPLNHLTTLLVRRNGQPHRYWRIGTTSYATGASHWDAMRDKAHVAIGWKQLGDLSDALAADDFKESVRERFSRAYPRDPRVVGRTAQQVAHFCRRIEERDYVLACDGARVLGIGRVTGPYAFVAADDFPHQRPVEWLDVGDWQLPTTEGLQTTVHEYKRYSENISAIEQRLLEAPHQRPPTPKPKLVAPSPIVKDPGVQWSGGGTIGRVQDVLTRKRQAILYGPPGTGKTFWAERAATNLAALWNFGAPVDQLTDAQRERILDNGPGAYVRHCCFHPGFGYEDFIEGYRPKLAAGAIQFALEDGLFKRLCDEAGRDAGGRYYLVVDEINRGDIPRIFGELISLIDKPKRGTSTSLPLSRSVFAVPDNVFLIGTMNTADRSIALLDAALRRRFGFIELLPDPSVLGETIIHGIPLGPWLAALNRLIAAHVGRDGRSLQVGHSYFLSGGHPIQEFGQLAHVLQEDVLPLLEEYCYDDWQTLEHLLGTGLVDMAGRRFKLELFAPNRQADLVQALLACTPEVASSPIAVAAEVDATQDELSSDSEEGPDET